MWIRFEYKNADFEYPFFKKKTIDVYTIFFIFIDFSNIFLNLNFIFSLTQILTIIECSGSTTKLNDVFIVNLALCSDVQVKREAVNTVLPDPPQSLNLQRLNTRVRNTVEQKRRLVSALAAGVSPDGQKLFLAIAKTINEVITFFFIFKFVFIN